jgi:hypothetical protein
MTRDLETKTLFIALLVGIAHIVCGIMVFIVPNAAFAAPISALVDISMYFGVFGTGVIGATIFIAGVMAVVGSTASFSMRVHVGLFIPQQILLMLQLYSISAALVSGHYPDGYVPVNGAWFILTDQIWAWILAVSHSCWLAALILRGEQGGGSGAY